MPENIHELIRRDIQHDIYVISAQNWNDLKLEKIILNILGNSYIVLEKQSYRGLTLIFICRKKISEEIYDIKLDHYRDADKSTKAVAIGLKIADKSYAFVNCYISPAHQAKSIKLLDSDVSIIPKIVEIDRTLDLRPTIYEESKLENLDDERNPKVSEFYDACIFMGGFNTPIVGSARGVNAMILSNMFESLKRNDKMYLEFQNYLSDVVLNNSSDQRKLSYDECRSFEQSSILNPYHEGEIMFAPTFKVTPFTDIYDTSIQNSKDDSSYWGWTDRIMFTINEGQEFKRKVEFLKQISYDSNNLIKSSQYRPVFSQFLINF